MEIYRSRQDEPILDWQWYEPSLRNITHLVMNSIPHEGGQALDVGCGTGRLSFALAKEGYQVLGIDPEERVIGLARRIAGADCQSPQFVVGDFTDAALARPNFFDVVVCSEVLEHVQDYKSIVTNMHAALKPGGHVIVTVPYDPNKWSTLDEYGGHLRRFTIPQITQDLNAFRDLRITITGFPFYRLLVRTYLVKLGLSSGTHSNEKLWENRSTRLVASILYPFMRLDNLFSFTRLGDALLAVARK